MDQVVPEIGAQRLPGGGTWRQRLRAGVAASLPVVGIVLGSKALVLLLGGLSAYLYEGRWPATPLAWLERWNRWDAPHYLDLAQYGYQTSGEMRLWLVFYPLFPWLTRLTALLVGNALLAAFVVSTLASLATGLLLQRLAALDYPPDVARRAVWFLFIFPTGYFLHIGYTESLFLALTLASWLAARRRRWWLAGSLGALAGLTRVNGLLLLPALLVEAASEYRATRRWNWSWLGVALAGLGFGGYLLLNWYVTGDPWRFLEIQREHWFKTLAWPWQGMQRLIASFHRFTELQLRIAMLQEPIFIVLGVIGTLATWRWLRPAYGVWMLGNWLLITSTSWILSVPRYTLVMFPLFVLMALLGRHWLWLLLLSLISLWGLSLFACWFAQGMWAF